MSAPFDLSNELALDDSGNPLPGAKLEFYVSGTSTPLDTYSNFGNSSANTNPVVADANGRFGAIYMQPRLYKVVLKTAAGVTIWTKDPYCAYNRITASALPGAAFPGLIVDNSTDGNSYKRDQANAAWVNLGPTDSVANTASITEILTGTATDKLGTPDSIAGLWEQGADVAAGSTLSLPTTGGGVFRVTGASTTISAINTATNGREVDLFLVNAQTFADGSGIETLTGSAMTLPADTTVTFRRIASVWRMTSAGLGPTPLPRGHLFGMILSNNAVDPTNDIDISAGNCRDALDTDNITFASAITKRLDANWAVGTNQGGLDTGAIANTSYAVYAIRRPDTGVADAIFSTNFTSPTLPANYTQYRRLGAIIRTGGAIVLFTQDGDTFWRNSQVVDFDITAPTTSAVTRTVGVPVGIAVTAILSASVYGGTNDISALFSSLSVSDQAPQAPGTAALTGFSSLSARNVSGTGSHGFAELRVLTNASAQIRTRASISGVADKIGCVTKGWIDTRGRVA